MNSVIPGLVGLGCIRKVAEKDRGSKSINSASMSACYVSVIAQAG